MIKNNVEGFSSEKPGGGGGGCDLSLAGAQHQAKESMISDFSECLCVSKKETKDVNMPRSTGGGNLTGKKNMQTARH